MRGEEGKRRVKERTKKGSHLQSESSTERGTLNPETIGSRASSISNDGSRPYPTSPLWVD